MGSGHVDAVNGCHPGSTTKIGVYQDRTGSQLANGDGGQFTWDAPGGIEIFGTVFTGRLNDINGIRAQLLGPGDSGYVALDEGQVHDGQQRTTRWTNRSQPRSLIVARLECWRTDGCPNAMGGTKAFFEVTDAEFKSRDVVAPALTPSGLLWLWANDWRWHAGSAGFRTDAGDFGSGVASTFLLVNGLRAEVDAVGCSGDRGTYATRFDPCPSTSSRNGAVNTAQAPFQEGVNLIQFCVADYASSPDAANRTCTSQRFVFVDNVAPGAPIDLRPLGGTDWRPDNGFDVVWRNPEDQRSEIVEVDFQVIRLADAAVVDAQTRPVGEEPALPRIDLPAPGEYRVEVRLRDAAGNLGPPSSTTLRFDDAQPGDIAPEPPPGWISADELPYEQEIERAEPGGPSGVGGYAFAVSRSGPVTLCPSGVCQPLELSLNGGVDDRIARLNDLAEGNHWVSAVAASGARVPSESVGTRVLAVDKTEPLTTLVGLPNRWVNQPVTLTALASDTASGMSPAPGDDGDPLTAIHAEGSAAYEAPGDSATFTIADEGVTQVEYWARDLAGNANDGLPSADGGTHARPGLATVRIDRRPPGISLDRERDPRDPEAIVATVRDGDSGLDYGTISFRPMEAGGPFSELETTVSDKNLSARLPSDDLPSGRYLIRAEARDRAGNSADTGKNDSDMMLNLPLKRPVSLTAAFSRGKGTTTRATAAHARKVRIEGRLSRARRSVAGVRLVVEERFVDGSRRKARMTTIRTDGAGRYANVIGPGTSRTIRVRYAGSPVNQRTSSRELSLTVKDRVTFRIEPRVLRNRGRVRMSGSVKGKGALRPSRGKLVAIQYFDPARARWRPVEVLRANRRGRFSYSYRFRTIEYAQRILFRAVSLPESGWPFNSSTSDRRSVIVYPAK